MLKINIIGGGLAGSECALTLAKMGHIVHLYDIKGEKMTPAHHSKNYAEIVCSNSFKSDDELTAGGLFKRELLALDSELIKIAYTVRVPAGQSLAVDREKFSSEVTRQLKSNKNIILHTGEVTDFEPNAITIVATGPLSTDGINESIKKKIGAEFMYFYDAESPIIDANSIDMSKAYFKARYDKGDKDYLNCPLNKEEYLHFYTELVNAKRAQLHPFEKNIFEGCMPIEILANRGIDAMRFGPMKPVGLNDPSLKEKPYAVVQLRKENEAGTMYNIVGFQTNLTFPEQKRVFSIIPALEKAEFLRYGVMHTNNYINYPKCLDEYSRLKNDDKIYIAGQISGVEGYVESIMSGLYCALNVDRTLKNRPLIKFSTNTIIGGIYNYLLNANADNFQPINANYGVLSPIDMKDKKERNKQYLERSLNEINQIKQTLN